MEIIHLTTETFMETIKEGVSLVDFWADWCGPCHMLAPTIEALAIKYEGAVKVCKIDVDAEPALAQTFGVMSIPTVIVFKDGAPTLKATGVQPLEAYDEMIEMQFTIKGGLEL